MAGEPQKEFIDKLKALTGNTVVGYSANDSLVTAIAKIAATLDHPARFYASETPDEYLNFTGFSTVKGDGTAKVLPPDSSGSSGVLLTSGKVSLKTGAVIGTTPLLLASGAAFSLPVTTAGQYRRLAIKQTATAFYAVFGAAYSGAYSYAALEDPGTLWLQAPGTPVCFIDLQAYSNGGSTAFKTALSSTNVVENNVGGTSPMIYEVANVSDRGRLVVNQDRNLRLVNGGNWQWAATTSTLTWSDAAQIEVPGVATSANNILAGSLVVADDQVIYADINRSGSGGNITLVAAAASSVSVSDNRTVIGYRTGTSLYLGINSSILYADGDNRPIGALVNVSSSQEYDAGVFSDDLVTIDLSKGVAQKFQLTNPNAQIKLTNGIAGVTYTVRGYFDRFIPYNGALGLYPNSVVSSHITQNLTTEPHGQFIISATCAPDNEYLVSIYNYDGLQLKTTNIDSIVPGNFSSDIAGFIRGTQLFLWGNNGAGQLGRGDVQVRPVVSEALPLLVSKAAIGQGFVCAIEASTGLAWTWGSNSGGRLGTGNITARSSPTSVLGGRSYSDVYCAPDASILIEGSTGYAWTWGVTSPYGKLGTGDILNYSSPVSVLGARSYSKVVMSSGNSSYAIEASTGCIWAWGLNYYGQLGTGNTSNASSPVSVVGGRSFKDIAAGAAAVVAIEASTGYAWSWGYNLFVVSSSYNLGDDQYSPVSVVGGRSWSKVVAAYDSNNSGEATFLALEGSTGKVYGWGTDLQGYPSIFFGTSSPTLVKPKSHTTIGASGGINTNGGALNKSSIYGVEASVGALYTLYPSYYALDPATFHTPVPTDPSATIYSRSYKFFGSDGISRRSIFLEASTGYAYCWGYSGSMGSGTYFSATGTSSPVSVLGGRSYKFTSSGYDTALAIEGSTGYAWTWGQDISTGALGNGTVGTIALSPVSVLGGRSYSKAAAMLSNVVAIEASTGYAWAWGSNGAGQLGNGTMANSSSPVSVLGGRSYSDVHGSGQNVAMIEGSTGYLWTFGSGYLGALGTGSADSASSPVSVLGARSYSAVKVGITSTVAIEGSTGFAWAWGNGAIGDGTAPSASINSSPVSVLGARSYSSLCNINFTSTNYGFIALEGSTGLAWAWGSTTFGLLGMNTKDASSPTSVYGGRSFNQVLFTGEYIIAQEGATGSYYTWGSVNNYNVAPPRSVATFVPSRRNPK